MNRRLVSCGIALLIMLAVSGSIQSQTPTPIYKEYSATTARELYFVVCFDKSNLRIVVPSAQGQEEILVGRRTISTTGAAVTSAMMVLFDERGLIFQDSVYPYLSISDMEISQNNRETEIKFFTSERARSQPGSLRRSNRVSFDQDIDIAKDEFVRGGVFSVKGNIRVAGEVNKDVVSLFGDVTIAPDAVVRGDVADITGTITVAKTAVVYGDIYSGVKKSWIRRHRLYRGEEDVTVVPRFSYNRVDGFAPYATVKYQDQDSSLPTAWGTIGYAFASERLRFELGMEQRVLRTMSLTAGAKYGRRLASSDDWLIGDGENTAFALLVTEDFKDFYESEGGSAYLKAVPSKKTRVEIGFTSEETTWLRAHRNLWSLFGGGKRFGENFATVDRDYWTQGVAEIDTTTNVYLSARAEYDGTDRDNLFGRSAWRAWGTLEWSDESFGSDFGYRRYLLQARRYQKATKQSALLVTGTYGASDGYLPMHRRFFLGGIGTLYGYRHKEYIGARFWMFNTEYRFAFPRRDIALSLLWDFGQVSNAPGFDTGSDVKHSVGAAMYIGRGFRLSLAWRLDRSSDNEPKLYVRLNNIY